jgi:hypothetical protein
MNRDLRASLVCLWDICFPLLSETRAQSNHPTLPTMPHKSEGLDRPGAKKQKEIVARDYDIRTPPSAVSSFKFA